VNASKYLQFLLPTFNTSRTKQILRINPTIVPQREEAREVKITVFDFDQAELNETACHTVEDAEAFLNNHHITWINIDGIRKNDIEKIATDYNIHPLIIEDIMSVAQRPKFDEIDGLVFCLLNMLYLNENSYTIETEQISIVVGKDFLISFQEDPRRDVLNPIREKLRIATSKLRQSGADYLCYALIDVIVDNYYLVLEKMGERVEELEEEIIRFSNTRALAKINNLRKELIVMKRNVVPVRDMLSNLIKSDSDVLEERTVKYFKDVYDHIMQATDLVENYRDMMISLQDLYMSRVNMKLNEVMKVMAIVTCLLAPASVISGIFGMNFEVIPIAHQQWGFYLAVGTMITIIFAMLLVFKKRGWF
jgi:magnesium transporter